MHELNTRKMKTNDGQHRYWQIILACSDKLNELNNVFIPNEVLYISHLINKTYII